MRMTEERMSAYVAFFALAGKLSPATIDAVLADLPTCDCLPFVILARRAFDDRRSGRGLTMLAQWREDGADTG